MPKNKSQEIIFSIMMVLVMVFGMVTYNISLNTGGLTNEVFLIALTELPLMGIIAFMVEELFVSKIAKKKAGKIVNQKHDNPFTMVIMMSIITVCLMCPIMSLIATIMHHGVDTNFIAKWIQTTATNFPMALCYQLFYAGPFVRFIFNKIFK
jgi:hypothetical protein